MKIIFALLTFSALSTGSDRPTIQELIAKYEGWSRPHSLTHQLHNPGALSFANQPKAIRGTGGYAKWETDEEGWQALDRDLQAKIKKHQPRTLRELLRFWDSRRYLGPMAKELGIDADAQLRWILVPNVKWGWRLGYVSESEKH
jgi:hypothetical protein